jgi:hypothetical protein
MKICGSCARSRFAGTMHLCTNRHRLRLSNYPNAGRLHERESVIRRRESLVIIKDPVIVVMPTSNVQEHSEMRVKRSRQLGNVYLLTPSRCEVGSQRRGYRGEEGNKRVINYYPRPTNRKTGQQAFREAKSTSLTTQAEKVDNQHDNRPTIR